MAKLTRPMIRIHDLATNEVIDREMNDAEFSQHEIDVAGQLAKQAEAEAKTQIKVAAEGKLAALGLTTDDLRALGL